MQNKEGGVKRFTILWFNTTGDTTEERERIGDEVERFLKGHFSQFQRHVLGVDFFANTALVTIECV